MAVDDIFVGQNGLVFVAPYGTALPAKTSDALDPAFISLGEINEEGLTHAFSVDKTMLKNWRGESVRTLATSNSMSFSLTFYEDAQTELELFYGAELTGDGTVSSLELGQPIDKPWAMVIALTDGDRDKRFVLPRVEVSERGEQQISNGTAGRQYTFESLYDSTTKNQGWLQFSWDVTAPAKVVRSAPKSEPTSK